MQPTGKKYKKILPWVCLVAVFVISLGIGRAYGRHVAWASAELVYTPPVQTGYESDCLTAQGQDIRLSDWTPGETEKSIIFHITRPPVTQQVPENTPEQAAEETPNPDEELTVIPDEAAQQHITWQAQVQEGEILITLTRLPEAPGLAQSTELRIELAWQGLSGTVCVNMLPYGEIAQPLPEDEEVQREIVVLPDQVRISDTIHSDHPVVYVQLNLQTKADFTVFVTVEETALNRVRWSMDGGKTYVLRYDTFYVDISYPYPDNWDGLVVLDMSSALQEGQRPTVGVEATGHDRYECTPVIQALPEFTNPVLHSGDLPQTMKIATKWGPATMQLLHIERLSEDEEGNLIYTEDNALRATVIDDGIRMETAQQELLPPSGSYRIHIQWRWNDICVEQQTVYFFVNTQ